MSWRGIFIEDDSSWPGLGFNPARGEVGAINKLATDLRAVGREFDELHELVTSVGKDQGFWQGEGADAFRKKLGQLPKYLQQGNDSMSTAGRALLSWHDTLESLQRQANPLESRALTARRELEHLSHAANTATANAMTLSGDPEVDRKHGDRAKAANSEAQAAKERLDALIRQGEELHQQWKEAAARAAHAVRKATDLAPESIGLWERITDGLKSAMHNFTDWLVEHADTLSKISSGLALAAVAVQAIPVVGQVAGAVLGTGAVLCSAGAMVGHYVGMRRGNGSSWLDLGGDALGLLPGVGAIGSAGKAGGNLVLAGARFATRGNSAKMAKNIENVGTALRKGGHAINDGTRAGFVQGLVDKAAVPIAGKFGVTLAKKSEALRRFQIGSQSTIKSGLFIYKMVGG
ncbi:putative T7SS-secreted protein [Streptomyces sp. NPDC047315]|uniref:WXG100 family type VII secretion target n=1 Tax=Streptomyces sp. NPDC047315 TaxID=3155142 RepID=UPI00340245BA